MGTLYGLIIVDILVWTVDGGDYFLILRASPLAWYGLYRPMLSSAITVDPVTYLGSIQIGVLSDCGSHSGGAAADAPESAVNSHLQSS